MNIPDLQAKIKAWLRTDTGNFSIIIAILVVSNIASFYLGQHSLQTVDLENLTPSSYINTNDYSLADPELPKQGSLAAAIIATTPTSSQNAPESAFTTTNEPDSAPRYVASKRGRVYYFTWCAGAKSIVDENRVYFTTAVDARAAGLKPSTACSGLD